MGYSCNAISAYACDAMLRILQAVAPHPDNISNGWQVGNLNYFFERGREQADGSITGSVWQQTVAQNIMVSGSLRRKGCVKITADGVVKLWPMSTATQRAVAHMQAQAEYNRDFRPSPVHAAPV